MKTAAVNTVSLIDHDGKAHFAWPRKVDVFGVSCSPTTYEETTETVIDAARNNVSGVVSCHAVHALITASSDPKLREMVNAFEIVTPDGQPVRWALNLLHGTKLKDRVYGPELTLWICRQAAKSGVSIYLYGGSLEVVEKLQANLCERFPGLKIAGYESPPFRPLTAEEDEAVVQRMNDSGAGIVFIGLGCPKQDIFAFEHRDRIRAVQVCVGAAFDFHAGTVPMAPRWMQRGGLEWLYRLLQEPRRLFRRYLVTNSVYLKKLVAALSNLRRVRRQHFESKKSLSTPHSHIGTSFQDTQHAHC